MDRRRCPKSNIEPFVSFSKIGGGSECIEVNSVEVRLHRLKWLEIAGVLA